MKRSRIKTSYFIPYYRVFAVERCRISDPVMVRRVVDLLWRTIKKHYVENEGGVYLDNIGYLCHIIKPERKFVLRNSVSKNRVMTGGYGYRHVCLQMEKTVLGRMRYYASVDLLKSLKRLCDRNNARGNKYKFFYREILEWNKGRHINKPKRFYNVKCWSKIS